MVPLTRIASEVIEEFLDDFSQRGKLKGRGFYSPASLQILRRGLHEIDLYLRTSGGDLAAWTSADVDRYRAHLCEQFSPSTVALYAEFTLEHFFRFLETTGFVTDDPTIRAQCVYRTRTIQNTTFGLPDDPLEAIIESIVPDDFGSARDGVVLGLLLHTGPKSCELLGVTVSDVDFQKVAITYRRNGRARALPLEPRLCSVIHEYSATWRESVRSAASGDALLLSRTGRPLDRTNLWRSVKRRLDDIAEACPKELRNEFVRRLVRDETDREEVIKLTGYCSVSQTYVFAKGAKREPTSLEPVGRFTDPTVPD